MNRTIARGDVYRVAPVVLGGVEIAPETYATIVDAMPLGTDRYTVAECGRDGIPNGNRHLEIGGRELRWLVECGQWTLETAKSD